MARRSKADRIADELSAYVPRIEAPPPQDFLSTGCTLMNLAFSGHPQRGVPKSNYLLLVGDSGSSKTWLTFMLCAEAARNRNFDKYRFVHDNAENGALMDLKQYFGAGVAERLEAPAVAKDRTPIYSTTAQEFYIHLEQNCDRGPCIYVLDSMDALNDDADQKRFDAEVHKYETGEGKVQGTMGMEKAKTNSKNINRVVRALRTNGSILVVISQTRDKIGGMYPGQKTRGGGKSLKFFAHLEAWTSLRAPITKRYLGKEREVGATIKVDIQKNRVCGWEGKFEVPFLKGYGVDDLGGCVEYLIEEKHWKRAKKEKTSDDTDDDPDDDKGARFVAPEFDIVGTKEQIIQRVQRDGDERELQNLTAKVWHEIIDRAKPERKPKYQ